MDIGVLTEAALVAAASSSPRYASDLEQARPQTSGEEELQLQLALAMSREEAEKVRPEPAQGPMEEGKGSGAHQPPLGFSTLDLEIHSSS